MIAETKTKNRVQMTTLDKPKKVARHIRGYVWSLSWISITVATATTVHLVH